MMTKLSLAAVSGVALSVLAGVVSGGSSPAHAQTGQASQIPQASTQMLVVTTADWNAVDGTMQRYERSRAGGKWKAVGDPVPVVVGKNGLGWGQGIVAVDAAVMWDGPVKKEGDGKAPAGVFSLSSVFGYAAEKPGGWKMPYTALTPSIECVDDTASKFYNRVVDRSTVSPDWKSSEQMRRPDELYTWGVVVDHNSNPVAPGWGSCIFLHVWRGQGKPTVGCTAMAQPILESVIAWLDPAKQPILVQLPAVGYERLRKRWKLPKVNPISQH